VSTQEPDLGQLLAMTIAATRGPMKVAIPATVVAYNPTLQSVTVKPTVMGRYQDVETGGLVPFPLPTIANVPVAFPSATGFAITWPLTPGDTVFLVCADRSIDEWKSTGLPENLPLHTRRFDLTDAVAIPGLRPFTSPIPATGWSADALVIEGLDIRLGSSAASSFVVLWTLLSAFLGTLKTWLDTHTHTSAAPGSPTSPPVAPSPAAGNLGATRVKAL